MKPGGRPDRKTHCGPAEQTGEDRAGRSGVGDRTHDRNAHVRAENRHPREEDVHPQPVASSGTSFGSGHDLERAGLRKNVGEYRGDRHGLEQLNQEGKTHQGRFGGLHRCPVCRLRSAPRQINVSGFAFRDRRAPQRVTRRGYSTMTRSVPERPNVSGAYICSAFAGGTTKRPGVVARAT